MIKKIDAIVIGHDPDFCRFIGLNVEFLRSSPPLFFMERLGRLWGYKPEYYGTFGGNTGSTYLESIPCGLCLEDYRLKRFFAPIPELVQSLKRIKTEAPELNITEIGWYYQGRESRIFTQPLNEQGLPILQRHPEYKEGQKEAFLRSLEGTIMVHEAGETTLPSKVQEGLCGGDVGVGLRMKDKTEEDECVICPTTGRKLNPNTLLPIEEHIDFNHRSVLC